ncbi:MAG: phosphoribosylaminoimidazolesuccinocarboxamide synthase, partial [Fervidobacterium pennivorans]
MGIIISEGKTKIVEDLGKEVILHFKDDITAGDGQKHDVIQNKGAVCAEITSRLMKYLNDKNVPTMFVEFLPPNKIRARKLRMLPLEVIVRFKKAGSFIRRYGGTEGEELPNPLVEFTYKNDELHDPLMCVEHLEVFGITTRQNAQEIINLAKETGLHLREFFAKHGLDLWDMKFEFG